ncbi:MAG TPA: M50 family metallopeptidase [Candidatus Acidoferrales bacterium]|nr:M50 family metallopeptidase [Candidatus Acidoferrales bacterium]
MDANLLALPAVIFIQKLAVFVATLFVLIILHEYGHFLVARLNRVRVSDFAFGFGPTIAKWTSPRSGVNYRFNLVPIGGYCAMEGEDGRTLESEQQRAFLADGALDDGNFQAKSPLQRLSIVLAGPIANFILAFAILVFSALVFGVASDNDAPTIGPIMDGTPAQRAGLQMGDQVVAINGVPVTSGAQLINTIHSSLGKVLVLRYRRNGIVHQVSVTPMRAVQDGKVMGIIGFHPVPAFEHVGPIMALRSASEQFVSVFVLNVEGIEQLVANPVQHYGQAMGVIGMERAASEFQDLGWATYFSFAAVISIAVGLINLLPFPALDGGRGAFIVAELVRGRPIDREKEALVHYGGFAVLMMLMAFMAFHDISNIIAGKGVL